MQFGGFLLERPLSLDSSLAVWNSSLTANVSQLEGEALASRGQTARPLDTKNSVQTELHIINT